MATLPATPWDAPDTLTRPAPMRSVRVGFGPRLVAGVVACGCLAMLGIGAWLVPSAAGHGTHQRLGLAPCGWVLAFGKPCPTCGMTTAVAHAADADFAAAFVAQPMGLVIALGAATLFWGAMHVALTGSRLGTVAARAMTPRLLWVLAALTGAAWAYKFATWSTP